MRYGLTKTRTRLPRPSRIILPSIRSRRQLDGFARSRWHPAAPLLRKARLHQKVATSIFFESNGGQAKAEATLPEILAEPDLDVGNVGTPTTPSFQVQAFLVPPMPRHWFETESGEHLVQLQPDRIIHNWRQRNPEMQYPRYETVREKFVPEVGKLAALLRKEQIGEIRPNQCEVTYINTISLSDGTNPQQS
jgi:hypothetical protein